MSGLGDLALLGLSTDFLTAWPFWIGVGITAGIYGLLALGLQLNVGFTGVINFGQAGFMAIGAYSAVILVVSVGLPYYVALPLSMLITVIAGLLIGLPALRLRADYLAIATIAFAEVVRITAQNARTLTGGNQGTLNIELDHGRFFIEGWRSFSGWITDNLLDPIGISGSQFIDLPLLLTVWTTLIVLAFVLTRLVRSPWGRVLRAVREDEDAARALGKNAFAYKLQSLAIAAAIGAIAGWFLAFQLQSVNQTSFEPLVTFLAYAVLVLGGLASFWGVLVGAFVFWFMLDGLRELGLPKPLTGDSPLNPGSWEPMAADEVAALRFIVAGLILILIMALRPQGALGKREEMVLRD